jgi:hypothetical protein
MWDFKAGIPPTDRQARQRVAVTIARTERPEIVKGRAPQNVEMDALLGIVRGEGRQVDPEGEKSGILKARRLDGRCIDADLDERRKGGPGRAIDRRRDTREAREVPAPPTRETIAWVWPKTADLAISSWACGRRQRAPLLFGSRLVIRHRGSLSRAVC